MSPTTDARPLVSVITPSFCQQAYIGECLDSVARQSYVAWEQIVVDDGSTDATPNIVAARGDDRVRLIRLPHRGLAALAATYNTGLAAARGELIAVLEGDDAWPADKLSIQVAAFRDPDVLISWGRGAFIDETGRRVGSLAGIRTDREHLDIGLPELFAKLVRTNILTPAASVVIRRSALEAIGGFQQAGSRHYVDLATWLSLAGRLRGRARFINRELASYRVHAQQTSQRHARAMDAEHQDVVESVAATLPAANRERLGWHHLARDSAAARLIADGRWKLHDRDFREARRLFSRALFDARLMRDRLKGALGLGSALLHANVLDRSLAARSALLARETSGRNETDA
jgi:hypothetical protein